MSIVLEMAATSFMVLWAICGLRISSDPHTDNPTPQETTNQDTSESGLDRAVLPCPGSSVVATGIHGQDQDENKSGEVEN